MSKSILYAANTSTQTVAAGGTVNFGTTVRRYGCCCDMSGGNVTVNAAGYYDVDANLTFTAAAGTATVQLLFNGTAVPGAEASVTTVADTLYSVEIPAVIRMMCPCAGSGIISAVITGVATSVSNAAISVVKL